jgi:hypothetical protein
MGASNSVVECQLPKLKVAGSNPVSRSSFLSAHPSRLRLRLHWSICAVVMLLSLTACKPDPLGKALQGELSPDENNLVVIGYCQSCHIHRALNPSEHLTRARTLYSRAPYTTTTQCRACHLVSEDTWNMKHRKTIFPVDVLQNRYTAHERRFLKDNPEFAKGPK